HTRSTRDWSSDVCSSDLTFARGGWAEVEETHSSGYLVSDALDTRTSAWWTTNVRVGWDGAAGSLRLRPFLGFNNVFNRSYVGSEIGRASCRVRLEGADSG